MLNRTLGMKNPSRTIAVFVVLRRFQRWVKRQVRAAIHVTPTPAAAQFDHPGHGRWAGPGLSKATGAIRSMSSRDRYFVLAVFIARSLLTQKEIARRVVRSVNQRVAIGAPPVEVLDGTKRLRLCGVAARIVARVANPWHPHLQQLWIAAAVRLVAVGAVFHDRRMLPQKWTPAFGMATEAVLINRALNSWLGFGLPCGLWQLVHVTLPSRYGMCEERCNCARRIWWHCRHNSGCGILVPTCSVRGVP